ncbi:MAG: DUF302 domain-containing protein [Candidatus Hodarchaeales archaeon]|jgi:uncharacterized protein (DUF302 family)
MAQYYFKKEVQLSYDEAIKKATDELKKEGFGVLTTIDVKKTLKKKIDVDYDDYMILGACNPPFAHKALLAEKNIGVLLPCNVIVYSESGKVFVSALSPKMAMSVVQNDKLKDVAEKVEEKLKRVVENV